MAGYITYWSKEHIKNLEKAKDNGPLVVIYGSQHTKMPTIQGIKEGDIIYPVTLMNNNLYVMARMPVEKMESAYDYLLRETGNLYGCLRLDTIPYDKDEQEEIPHKAHQRPQTCCAALAASSTSGSLISPRLIPPEKIPELKFGSTKSKEKTLRLNKEGKLTTVSLSGFVRKMNAETQLIFEQTFEPEN